MWISLHRIFSLNMARVSTKSGIENFVDAYLTKISNTNKRRYVQYLAKAGKLIQAALRNPCCAPAQEVIFGSRDNDFTNTVRTLLIDIDTRKWRKSLTDTVRKINNVLEDPCCAEALEEDFVLPEVIVPDETHACGTLVSYAGGQTFPRIIQINLGAGTGISALNYQAFNIPDKFIVFFDGVEVINTGYRGNSGYQGQLTSNLLSRSLPNETIQGPGAGTLSFNKNTATAVAYVYVYAPLDNTRWEFTLTCSA